MYQYSGQENLVFVLMFTFDLSLGREKKRDIFQFAGKRLGGISVTEKYACTG